MRKLSLEIQKQLILSIANKGATRPLSPVEVAQAVDTELAAGTPIQELASVCGLNDPTMIKRFQRLVRLAPQIRHMVGWGKAPSTLSFTVASQIARLQHADQQEALCMCALENQLTISEVQEVIQLVETGHGYVEEAVNNVLRLRPRVHQLVAFMGLITVQSTRVRLAAMRQADRNELLQRAVATLSTALSGWSGTLGTEKFTLVGEPRFADQLRSYSGGFDGFERQLNELLTREVSSR